MARVTVEDCIDKVENRFDLVLLASHPRARSRPVLRSRSSGTTTRTRWWRCARSRRRPFRPTISRRKPFNSLQKYVEVDEPEPEAAPLIGSAGGTVDADDTEVTVDRMTEEKLLKGLKG